MMEIKLSQFTGNAASSLIAIKNNVGWTAQDWFYLSVLPNRMTMQMKQIQVVDV